jgi:hypothetical protein
MGWRRIGRPKPRQPLRSCANHQVQFPSGPQRTFHEDGTISEDSAAMGHSVIVPGIPARPGVDLTSSRPTSSRPPAP